jgi:hypothetical protein
MYEELYLHNDEYPGGKDVYIDSNTYWSSSEYDAENSWYQDFINGDQDYTLKEDTTLMYVRAIRSFTSETVYALRDVGPAGGWIFYKDGNNYLECSVEDQSTGIAWITGGDTQTTENGNTLTAIGTGLANTDFMAAQIDYTGGAAQECLDYSATNNLIVLEHTQYWSSSEYDADEAWCCNLATGISAHILKSLNQTGGLYLNTIAIRAFTSITNYDIGDSGQAGTVFYKNGDNYLEMIDDVGGGTWIEGGSTQTTENGNTSTDFGTGLANSESIVAQTGHTASAANICLIESIEIIIYSVGLNPALAYWTSSESSATESWLADPSDRSFYEESKAIGAGVRAIRYFTSETVYDIGDIGPAGGWIFYKSGNNYLEVAPEDQSSNVAWITGGDTRTTENGNTSTDFGTGLTNSEAIIAQTGHTSSAAQECLDYSVVLVDNIGEFVPDGSYWCSSEYGSLTAWYLDFSTGIFTSTWKTNYALVRAIRSFTSETIYAIGDIGPAGGWIFYKSGNNYLEAAPSDINEADIRWAEWAYHIIGTTGTAIGTGLANSEAMRDYSPGNMYSAAILCLDYLIRDTNFYIAGSIYWSSSEHDADEAIGQNFINGTQNNYSKGLWTYIRAIHAFQSETNYELRDQGPAGGWIFYKSGNNYLECAVSNVGSFYWILGGSTQTTLNGRTHTEIGTGLKNSEEIENQTDQTNSAAKMCLDLT